MGVVKWLVGVVTWHIPSSVEVVHVAKGREFGEGRGDGVEREGVGGGVEVGGGEGEEVMVLELVGTTSVWGER